ARIQHLRCARCSERLVASGRPMHLFRGGGLGHIVVALFERLTIECGHSPNALIEWFTRSRGGAENHCPSGGSLNTQLLLTMLVCSACPASPRELCHRAGVAIARTPLSQLGLKKVPGGRPPSDSCLRT